MPTNHSYSCEQVELDFPRRILSQMEQTRTHIPPQARLRCDNHELPHIKVNGDVYYVLDQRVGA